MRIALLLASLLALVATTVTASTCHTIVNSTATCPRDLILIVDGSYSINKQAFDDFVLGFVDGLFCLFDNVPNTKFGLIIFNSGINIAMPLKHYTRSEWQNAVAAQLNACCTKGTPLAEAWVTAAEQFKSFSLPNATRVAFTFTDGHPWQLNDGNPYARWPYPTVSPGHYWFNVVPWAAQQMQNLGVYHFIHTGGVADYRKDGLGSFNDYLNGQRQQEMVPRKGQDGYGKPGWECVPHPQYPPNSGKFACGQYYTSPLGIVTSKNSDTYDDLIKLVAGESCEIATPAPVVGPVDTPSPTLAPATPQTQGVDLTIFLDRSRSLHMGNEAQICGQFVPAGIPDSKACWWLFTNFVKQLAESVADIVSPDAPFPIGWQGDSSDPDFGLRLTVIAFWCTNNQKDPQYQVIGTNINTEAQMVTTMDGAFNTLTPDGGTCPSGAILQGVNIIANNLKANPSRAFQAALIFTDGVFYDMPLPAQAEQGLAHYLVHRYALGVALPEDYSQSVGKLAQERKTQKQQLLAFVDNIKANRFDLGSEGFSILPQVTDNIAQKIFDDASSSWNTNKGPWCGYTTQSLCVSSPNCKWSAKYGCRQRNNCKHCEAGDQYCTKCFGGKCVPTSKKPANCCVPSCKTG